MISAKQDVIREKDTKFAELESQMTKFLEEYNSNNVEVQVQEKNTAQGVSAGKVTANELQLQLQSAKHQALLSS